MVAPRNLPRPSAPDRIAGLAARWARTAAGRAGDEPSPLLADRLATLLRRFAVVLHAEPFFPRGARAIGVDLPATGLCGDPNGVTPAAADVLARTLRLLRERAPAALDVPGEDGQARLTAALDELATGFTRTLADLARPGPSHRLPPMLGGGNAALDPHHLRAFFQQSPLGMAVVGLDGHVIDVNPAMLQLAGMPAFDEPRPLSDHLHPDDVAGARERYTRLVKGEPDAVQADIRLVRADTSVVVPVHTTSTLVRRPDGSPSHIVVVVEDAATRPSHGVRVEEVTVAEQLSRLPGRSLTESCLRRMFDGEADRVGVCALDLDGFQAINDALGHGVGDRLLLGVAGRLQLAACDHLVTRTGGDEFTVLIADPEDGADVCGVADRLQTALSAPFVIDGHVLTVAASVGVADCSTTTTLMHEVVRAADVARSWAKALGGGRRVVYDHGRDAAEAARYALVAGMPRGVANGEFRLAYQPLVALSDGRVRGVEALVRWQHPEQGLLGPGRFIPLAEQNGAIVDLGRWILRAACAQAARWSDELGEAAPYVSVNVSPVQMADPGWIDQVADALKITELPADRLQLEITEQAVLGEGAGTLEALLELREAGVRLALDDFGTGWSSLAWLRRLPVHALKIDGSFIDGLRHPVADSVDHAIVRSLIGMAHALGLEVTAEWVETDAQAQRLAALGCDLGQGRWFGDAGPADWVPAMVRRTIGS